MMHFIRFEQTAGIFWVGDAICIYFQVINLNVKKTGQIRVTLQLSCDRIFALLSHAFIVALCSLTYAAKRGANIRYGQARAAMTLFCIIELHMLLSTI